MSAFILRILAFSAAACWLAEPVTAQEISLHFQPVFNEKKIALGAGLTDRHGDSLSIHTLKFYLSNFVFYKNGKEIWREENSYHLLDMEAQNSMSIAFKTEAGFDQIKFKLGIDSLTNVSGAMGGDLDPTKGMYWAWNSGYINFKIEGFSEKCPARKNQFQFHIGGYMPPFQTVQNMELPVSNREEIQVDMELSAFFENIDLAEMHSIMSPSAEAAKLVKSLPAIFQIHEK